MITIRKFEAKDVARMAEIWNQVVEDGVAFPQEDVYKRQVEELRDYVG